MTHAERVPVKMGDVEIGIARVDDDGTIEITLNTPAAPEATSILLNYIKAGIVRGLSIMPIVDPSIESREALRQRASDYGFYHPKNDGHNY